MHVGCSILNLISGLAAILNRMFHLVNYILCLKYLRKFVGHTKALVCWCHIKASDRCCHTKAAVCWCLLKASVCWCHTKVSVYWFILKPQFVGVTQKPQYVSCHKLHILFVLASSVFFCVCRTKTSVCWCHSIASVS